MSKRFKIRLKKEELRCLNIYDVESIYDCSIIYLADNDGFAIYRQEELEFAPLDEAESLIERITVDTIREEAKAVLEDFKKSNDYTLANDVWFNTVKELGARHNFAESGKIFKQNPGVYVGHVGDVAEIIRVAVTCRKNTPNLHDVLVILGKDEVDRRIDRALASIK